MNLYLSVDVGTTNWKVGAFTSDGTLVSTKRTPTITHFTEDGCGYYHPNELWEAVINLLKSLTDELSGHQIITISCTGMAESMVALDENDEPIGDVIAWFDTKAVKHLFEIIEVFGKETIFNITGLDINPIFSLPKLLAYKSSHQKEFSRAVKWLQLPEYIAYMLSGVALTDYSLACRTMLFDIRQNKWSETLLSFIGLTDNQLAKVVDSGTLVGSIKDSISQKTGLPHSCQVVVGGHDHLCATIPAGATDGRNLLDSSGTAESFIYVSKKDAKLPEHFEGLRVGRYLTSDKYVLWGGIVASGASIEWGLSRLGESFDFRSGPFSKMNHDQFFETYFNPSQIKTCDLIYLPHLRGAGAPFWNPLMTAAFIGLKSTHTAIDMLNAIIYGLTFQSKMIVDLMEKVSGQKILTMNTVGGGSRIKYWQHLKALVHQRNVCIPSVSEATLMGAALLGAVSTGIYSSIDDASKNCYSIAHKFTPNHDERATLDHLYLLYSEAYASIKSLCDELSTIK